MKEDRLLALQKTDVEEIQRFMQTRTSATIPQSMQTYILQLDSVNRIMHHNRLSVRAAIEQLRREWPTLTVAQARSIYYDAIDYFYHDDHASARAWDMAYADAFDDLRLLAIAAGKLSTAQRCMELAHKLRTTVREAEDFKWQAPVYMVNINVKPEDLGYKSQKLADIARRAENKEYISMISSLETTEAEKKRLLADAGIREAEYVEALKTVDDDDIDEQL